MHVNESDFVDPRAKRIFHTLIAKYFMGYITDVDLLDLIRISTCGPSIDFRIMLT
jgi:hypothetical protein